jgi:N-acyl-D-aspartate/D-glutamate deacylase
VETCWDKIQICNVSTEKNKKFVGKSIAEVKPENKDILGFIFDLLIDEQGDLPVVILIFD